jgi:thiosulfate/3-mercaptopyruvate sulfurtransferase
MSEQLLVSTDWLAEHLADADLRIVDIRGHVIPASEPPPHYFNHQADYQKSHIPGAVFVDWVHEITDPDDPRHAQIAKPDRFAAVMSRIGIAPESPVVVYDDAKGMFAARLWWAINYYGHHRVAVLDGGWQKWVAEQWPTTPAIPDVNPTHFIPTIDPSWRRTGDQVLGALGTNTPLVDVRTPEEFAGASSRAKRKGHIPGAHNLPRTDLLAPDGTMLPAKTLLQKFEQAGVDESTPETILYCNSGISASYGLLAMKVAGLESGTVYDGSWKDWGNDDSKPVEK